MHTIFVSSKIKCLPPVQHNTNIVCHGLTLFRLCLSIIYLNICLQVCSGCWFLQSAWWYAVAWISLFYFQKFFFFMYQGSQKISLIILFHYSNFICSIIMNVNVCCFSVNFWHLSFKCKFFYSHKFIRLTWNGLGFV